MEEHHRLTRTYFPHDITVSKFLLAEAIKVQFWINIENVVKLDVLYVIQTFKNTTKPETKIMSNDFAVVDFGRYAEYLWGLASFRLLSVSLKRNQVQHKIVEGDRKIFHNEIDGCPIASQCWSYECYPHMNGLYSLRCGTKYSRILNLKSPGMGKKLISTLSKTICILPSVCNYV